MRRYVETGGREGHEWRGTTTLILTTRGRLSGEPRSTPLIYQTDGDAYLIVASKGGSDTPPAWFRNIEAAPAVTVQVRDERFDARARIADAQEKPRMWAKMVSVWPAYDDYQQRTQREIPIVVLERV